MIFRAKSKANSAATSLRASGLRKWVFTALSLAMLLGLQTDLLAADPAKGLALFKENCARCHSPALEKVGTGPPLYEVSTRIPPGDWIYRWVKNSNKVIGSGDKYANKIWAENAKAPMDAMPHLVNADIDDILAWIDSYSIPAVAGPGPGAGPTDEEAAALGGLWNWVKLMVLVIVLLLGSIAIQIARLRGIEFFAGIHLDKMNARLFLAFLIFGMIGAAWSSMVFQKYFILDNAASDHGREIDNLFWMTMVVVLLVFFVTNTILFWFAYKYGKDGGRKAKFYPENYKLEMIWTVVPAIVLTFLVIFGIRTWTTIMSNPDESKERNVIEVSGQQWGWVLRYPGDDEKLADIDVRRIGGDNILGVEMSEEAKDDFISQDLVIKKGAVTDLKIRSRDVLHSVYLPHFRVKMDAVPGMDTRFHFVANQTTEEYREALKSNPFWAELHHLDTLQETSISIVNGDSVENTTTVIDSVYRYETFDFELACTEVCGRGHYSMRKKVIVMEEKEYDAWYQKAKGGLVFKAEAFDRSKEFPQLADDKKQGDGNNTTILE